MWLERDKTKKYVHRLYSSNWDAPVCTNQCLKTFTGLQEAHGKNCLSEQQCPTLV